MRRSAIDRRLAELERAGPTLSLAVRAWLGDPLTEAEAVRLAQSGELSAEMASAARDAMTPELQAWLDERGEPAVKVPRP